MKLVQVQHWNEKATNKMSRLTIYNQGWNMLPTVQMMLKIFNQINSNTGKFISLLPLSLNYKNVALSSCWITSEPQNAMWNLLTTYIYLFDISNTSCPRVGSLSGLMIACNKHCHACRQHERKLAYKHYSLGTLRVNSILCIFLSVCCVRLCHQ